MLLQRPSTKTALSCIFCSLIMASNVTLIRNVLPGKIEWKLRVRVARLWTLPEYKNPLQPNSIEMILLDESAGKIHATVRKVLLPKFRDVLEEGSTYLMENLLVAQNDQNFRTTNHKYKLNFMGSTKCTKIDAPNILGNHFDFLSFPDILAASKEDRFLDVMGHVIEKDDLKEIEKDGKKTKLIDIVLQDLEQNRVHCTLWAEYAETMHQYLDSYNSSGPIIVILQMCKLKKYYGVMGISNAFFGTKLLINADIIDIHQYKERLDSSETPLTQGVSQMSGYSYISSDDDLLQTSRMTISDLIESRDPCFGAILARVIELEIENGWWYDSCPKCAHKACKVGTKFYCEGDNCKRMVIAVPRFKLHLKVIDHTGSTTFILFDRLVSNFIGKIAKDLIASVSKCPDDAAWLSELNSFLDKQFLFKVEVTDSNLHQNWQSYTVKRLSHTNSIIQQFITRHQGQVSTFEETGCTGVASDSRDEQGDSNSQICPPTADVAVTPTSKPLSKRKICDLDTSELTCLHSDPPSTSKLTKMPSIKVEPRD